MVLLCGGLNNEAAPRALLHKVCGLRNGLCLLGCKIGCWDAEDKNGGILQQVLHVLKPGKFCILLAKQAAGTGPVQGKNAVSYPESVRQMFFSVGFCDITELETSHLRDSNKIMKQGTLFNCTSNMIGILRLLTDHALPLLLGSIFICARRACQLTLSWDVLPRCALCCAGLATWHSARSGRCCCRQSDWLQLDVSHCFGWAWHAEHVRLIADRLPPTFNLPS